LNRKIEGRWFEEGERDDFAARMDAEKLLLRVKDSTDREGVQGP
jgi:hypothetical protein